MSQDMVELLPLISRIAEKAIDSYTRGILTVESLEEQMQQEWQREREQAGSDENLLSHSLLTRLAQRICSRTLYAACHSAQSEVYNCAFDNLQRLLERTLRRIALAALLEDCDNAFEEVVQQTLVTLHTVFTSPEMAQPDDPAMFIKWAQVVLIHHAHAHFKQWQKIAHRTQSIDEQQERFAEQLEDERNVDPQDTLIRHELRHILKGAILLLKNLRYRQVLFFTYLENMGERDLAQRLHVTVQDIYLWRHRGIKALVKVLRKRPDILHILEQWRK